MNKPEVRDEDFARQMAGLEQMARTALEAGNGIGAKRLLTQIQEAMKLHQLIKSTHGK